MLPSQLAVYTGAGCTGKVHVPQVSGGTICFDGAIGDLAAISTDTYCDTLFGSGEDGNTFNDQLLSLEVCQVLPGERQQNCLVILGFHSVYMCMCT